MEQHDPPADLREVVLDLDVPAPVLVGEDLAEQRPEARDIQLVVADLVYQPADRGLRREPERLVEGPVRRLHAKLGVQHQQRLAYGVHDGLGIEPRLLKRLGGDVREGDDDPLDPVVVRTIG